MPEPPPKPSKSLNDLSSEDFLRLLEEASPEELQALAAGKTGPTKPDVQGVLVKPTDDRRAIAIGAWWESRRPIYNICVGLAGLPTIVILSIAHFPMFALVLGAIAWGIAANVCYTLGYPAEMIANSLWKDKASHLGPILFTLGTIFSVVITLGVAALSVLVALAGL